MTPVDEWNPCSSHFEELEDKIERTTVRISAITTEYMEQYDNIIWNLNNRADKCNEMTTRTINK
jgi:hypothetical protein